MSSPTLGSDVAKSLPRDVELRIRHLTHAPVDCDPIFSPPPGEQPEPTSCQSHFLAVSFPYGDSTEEKDDSDTGSDSGHDHDLDEMLVFGIEVVVYTTSRLTTVFVSKADSTGYLYLLDLPPGTSSVLRSLSTAFLSYLVRSHQRPGVRLVMSLFARSQNQYLFPGSSENEHKHILDDRGLVKWWCRVTDPILRSFVPEDLRHSKDATSQATTTTGENAEDKSSTETENASATAYLIIPGCEKLETRAFFPATCRNDDKLSPRWINSYPLNQINSTPTAPPRCLVPRFPDDPKARFLIDLDDEITPENETGRWRSVKTLEQFWEMMAFRQECSAGRLVGFLWMVVNPPGMANSDGIDIEESQPLSTVDDGLAERDLGSPTLEDAAANQIGDQDLPATVTLPKETQSAQYSPRGVDEKTIITSHDAYISITDYFNVLDFANENKADSGSGLWLNKLKCISQAEGVGRPCEIVIGQNQSLLHPASSSQATSTTSTLSTNVLDTTLVRKRKRGNAVPSSAAESVSGGVEENAPVESATEARQEETVADSSSHSQEQSSSMPGGEETPATVNVLQAGLIRKKKKT